ncbi:MAG: crossover junction endodeoxyribonuclease RuvC [Candidatus Bathyarchaeia archaeon]|jgi:Holliday junction resolvasome RuvABC endonuclease subunit
MRLTTNNILALDQATHCGWAHSCGKNGVLDLSVKADESREMRLIRFRQHLQQIHKDYGIDLIVFEASRNLKFGNAVKIAAQLQAVIEMFCYDSGINYKGYSAKTIKKFATGNGNASKEMMMEAANEKWPKIKLISNDHADALWLLEMVKEEYNLN